MERGWVPPSPPHLQIVSDIRPSFVGPPLFIRWRRSLTASYDDDDVWSCRYCPAGVYEYQPNDKGVMQVWSTFSSLIL